MIAASRDTAANLPAPLHNAAKGFKGRDCRKNQAFKGMRRETSNTIRFLMEELLPPLLRDSRVFAWLMAKAYGPLVYDFADFRARAHALDDEEYATLYRRISAGRVPPPVHLGGRVCAWPRTALQAWIADPEHYRAPQSPELATRRSRGRPRKYATT